MVPSTGDSISRAPFASTIGASSRPVIGCSVLISMNSLPLTSASSSPFGPVKTFRTPLSSVMIEITISASAATAFGFAAIRTPRFAAACVAFSA